MPPKERHSSGGWSLFGLRGDASLRWHDGDCANSTYHQKNVTPAKAGASLVCVEMPAFAGMTEVTLLWRGLR